MAKLHDEDRELFMEGITYLDYARNDLLQALADARVRRLYRIFFRPSAIFMAALILSGLSFLGMAFHLSGSLSFSLAVLVYVGPLMVWVWTKKGEEDLSVFLENIHRSDKAIMDLGLRELLSWPTEHPEELMEAGVGIDILDGVVLKRQQSLEEYYREKAREEDPAKSGTA
ncbi:MAG: hypothetical protein H6727_03640 [Myxococcales bacterium]|nr:hypothetical protein [Myxococcales bacterium]